MSEAREEVLHPLEVVEGDLQTCQKAAAAGVPQQVLQIQLLEVAEGVVALQVLLLLQEEEVVELLDQPDQGVVEAAVPQARQSLEQVAEEVVLQVRLLQVVVVGLQGRNVLEEVVVALRVRLLQEEAVVGLQGWIVPGEEAAGLQVLHRRQ